MERACLIFDADFRVETFERGGQEIDYGVEKRLHAYVAEASAGEYGDDALGGFEDGAAEGVHDVERGNGEVVFVVVEEVLYHEVIVFTE